MTDEDVQMIDDQLAGLTPGAEITRLREGLRRIQAKVAAWEYKAGHNWSVDPIDLTMTAMYIDHLLEGGE